MENQEIKTDSYRVWYDPATISLYFLGSLRLSGMEEYAPIGEILDQIIAEEPKTITLDLTALEFLNSSGISLLSKFVINVRKAQTSQIVIRGSNAIPWQGKSLKNLQRLMSTLVLQLQ